MPILKFIYSEKATKFWEIFTLLLTVCSVVKSKVMISQNFVAFSEYMNFIIAAMIVEIKFKIKLPLNSSFFLNWCNANPD